MNRNDFLEILEHRVPGNNSMLGELSELIGIFPYFQSAHMLLLKGLTRNEDVRFSSQLRNSAVFIADREVLYNYLKEPVKDVSDVSATDAQIKDASDVSVAVPQVEDVSDVSVAIPQVINEPEPAIAEQAVDIPVIAEQAEDIPYTNPLSDEALGVVAATDIDREQTVIESAKNSEELIGGLEKDSAEEQEKASGEESEDVAQPVIIIIGDEEEEHSETDEFTIAANHGEELLELESETSSDTYNISTQVTDTVSGFSEAKEAGILSQADLIDRFIIANPRIEPIRDKKDIPIEDRSAPVYDESGFVTETLAKIYVSQGYYSRAIDIFERLTLKFPEKSSYFAAQIEKVKEYLKK